MDQDTCYWNKKTELNKDETRAVIMQVYARLQEKGYNPVMQLVGYLITGDPAYITNHGGARSMITKIDRHDALVWITEGYLDGLDGP